ncbi:hypothetical protein Btru_042661 [Bulinus truncatus]|nr:hypothetical protein Btru_042661 [Bulinus truncatus]
MTEPIIVPIFFSQRLLLACLSFLGTLMVYVTRVNMSVAIICMVRNTPLNVTHGNLSYSNVTNVTGKCLSDAGANSVEGSAVDRGDFDWNKETRSELLAMYFYGYICTQVLSGWLSSRYGGTKVWGVSMLVCGVCTLLTPVCARTNVYLMYAVRVIVGISSGVSFPCTQTIFAHWAPVYEKSKLISIAYAGLSAGNIVTFSISGLMCQYGFDNGWGSIFYLSGLFTLLWVLAWFILTADTPGQHRWISEREKLYLETAIGKGRIEKVRHVPWLKMIRSGPLWAAITAHFCNNYVNYTLLTLLPTFLKESLNFDIKQLNTIYFSPAFIGSAICMISVGQMTCEQRHIAVLLLCINTLCMSLNRAGFVVNPQDLAPGYAGVLFGITNTAGTVPGMIAPLIAGALTPNKTTEEWKNVFYVCAAAAVFGAIVYVSLAKGELQEWAVPKEMRIKMDILREHKREDHLTKPRDEKESGPLSTDDNAKI